MSDGTPEEHTMKAPFLLVIMAVFSDSYVSDVEEAFISNEIVPDTVRIAPKHIVNVSIHIGHLSANKHIKD